MNIEKQNVVRSRARELAEKSARIQLGAAVLRSRAHQPEPEPADSSEDSCDWALVASKMKDVCTFKNQYLKEALKGSQICFVQTSNSGRDCRVAKLDSELSIMRSERKRLEEKLRKMKSIEPLFLVPELDDPQRNLDHELRGLLVEESVERLISDYDLLAASMHKSLAEKQSRLARETEILNEHLSIHVQLQKRSKEKAHNKKSAEEIESKIERYTLQIERTVTQMLGFIDTHFRDSVREKKMRADAVEDGLQLRQLLEDLMNRAMLTPDKPYLPDLSQYSAEAVNLLVRANIAEVNPGDRNQLRLYEFS